MTEIGYNIEFAADLERAVYQDLGPFDSIAPNGNPMARERVWAGNARTGRFVMLGEEYATHGTLHAQTSWGPGNERFVASLKEEVRLYTFGTWQYQVLAKGREPRWSPDGKLLVYVGTDGQLKMGELGTAGGFKERDLGIEAPRGVEWSPDSRYFLYATKRLHPGRVMGTYSLAVYRVSDGATAVISAPLYDRRTNEGYGWVYLPDRMPPEGGQSK